MMVSKQQNDEIAKSRGISAEQVELLRYNRNLSDEAFAKLPEPTLRRAVRRLDYPDLPRLRESFQLLYAQDERGQIPPQALANALRQFDSTRARTLVKPKVAGIPTGSQVMPMALAALMPAALAGLHKAGWVAIGPGNIGGRTRSIVIHPKTPQTMWAGSVGGGVWRTDDGGMSWAPVDDFMANLAVSCMAMAPNNPKVIYAGTGEGFFNLDALRGAGIFRTSDGVSWQQLAATNTADFQNVNRLAISKSGATLLAATSKGIFRSTDKQRSTWSKVLDAGIADVKFDPKNSLRAVAAGLDDGNIYYSTNGGKHWKIAAHPDLWSGRIEVTYSLKNPTIVYASIDIHGGEIWRSTDRGKTFQKRTTLGQDGAPVGYLGEQGWYDNVIWAGDPTNENFVIVGGIDLWKSTDGGDTLIDISTWWDSASAHADHHAIVAHPQYNGTTNRTVFFGNDGGVYRADDVTTVGNDPSVPRVSGWQELNNTYAVTQFYGGAGNAATGAIIGGAQDNGTLCFKTAAGSEQWSQIFGGDGGWCASDPTDPQIFYGEYVFLNIHRNTDGGSSDDLNGDRYISGQFWNAVKGDWDWKPVPFRIPDAMNQNALFIAPFVLDPNNANCILAGGISLWRTNDARAKNTNNSGPRWAAIKPSVGNRISAIAVAPGNSDIIWVGHEDGALFRTINGKANAPIWKRMDTVGQSPVAVHRICTRVTIDPKNSQKVYVTFGGYATDNVWRSSDGGGAWQNIGGALPGVPVRAITIHPRKSNLLYLGSEVGVFASEDSGATWSPTNEGPSNCSVNDFFWLGETLVAVTHGRGMFKIDLSTV